MYIGQTFSKTITTADIYNVPGKNMVKKILSFELVSDPKNLLEIEQKHLDQNWKSGILFNACPTAGNCLVYSWKDNKERLQKQHQRLLGNQYALGSHHTDEHKEYMSIITKGRKMPKEFGEKISNKLKGKPKSDDHKRKLSEALKGHVPWNKGLKLK